MTTTPTAGSAGPRTEARPGGGPQARGPMANETDAGTATGEGDAAPVDASTVDVAPADIVATALAVWQRHQSTILPLVGLVGLLAYFGVAADNFLTYDNSINIAREASVLLLVSIGASWLIVQGSIDLSVGGILAVAALSAAKVAQDSPVLAAIVVGLLVGLAAGSVNGVLFAYLKIPSFLVTLGTSLALSGIALTLTGGRSVQIFSEAYLDISQAKLIGSVPNLVIWSVLIYLVAILLGARTTFGRHALAIGGGEAVAHLSGVAVRRHKFYAMAFSGLMASTAGILLAARTGAATVNMGDGFVLRSIAAVVMGGTALTGGVGGVHRTVLGVLVITILKNGMDVMVVGPDTQAIVQGAVVILAVAVTLDRSKITVLK